MSSETNSQRACRQQLCSPHTSLKPSHRDRLTPTGYRGPRCNQAAARSTPSLFFSRDSRLSLASRSYKGHIGHRSGTIARRILHLRHSGKRHQSRFRSKTVVGRPEYGAGALLVQFAGSGSGGDSRCTNLSNKTKRTHLIIPTGHRQLARRRDHRGQSDVKDSLSQGSRDCT